MKVTGWFVRQGGRGDSFAFRKQSRETKACADASLKSHKVQCYNELLILTVFKSDV